MNRDYVIKKRKEMGMSQKALAEKASIHYVTLSRFERGHSTGQDTIDKILLALEDDRSQEDKVIEAIRAKEYKQALKMLIEME